MPSRERPAPARRAPHVACLWMRDPEPTAHAHRIMPDGCADVVWVRGDRLGVPRPPTPAAGRPRPARPAPRASESPAGAAALGVRFRIGAAGSALGVPAREVLDRTVALEDVWGAAA